MTDKGEAFDIHRRVVRAAALGMVLSFLVLAGALRLAGAPWIGAVGAAALPTLFGGWYFGVVLALSRADFSGEDTPGRPIKGPHEAPAPTTPPLTLTRSGQRRRDPGEAMVRS